MPQLIPDVRQELARKAIERRKQLKLSIRQLSHLSGVSFSTIARVERGSGEFSDESLGKLARWLKDESLVLEMLQIELSVAWAKSKVLRKQELAQLLRVGELEKEIQEIRGNCP